MPATEARVHFGEVLRSVGDADIVVEKDGIPVAVVIDMETYKTLREPSRGALGAVPEPGAWSRFLAAKERGLGLTDREADAWIERVYRAREEGARAQHHVADAPEDDGGYSP